MKLQIITPDKGIEIDKEVCLVEADGLEGQFGILEGHLNFITPLKNLSKLRYQAKDTNPINEIQLEEAILEVTKIQNQTEVKVIASKLLSK